MLDKVKKYIKDNNLIQENDSIVLGVSGGADSVCLFLVLLELKKEFSLELFVVHINHGIRGEEAKLDSEFVEKLCAQHETDFLTFEYNIPNLAKERGISLEEAGREARYEAFYKVSDEKKSNLIAVAHNLNDNAETILLSLFRGTGIKGITGIKPKRDNIIRPLLCVDRNTIEEYLNQRNITYRTDSTNSQDIYARNKIRNKILPEIVKDINSSAVSHIVNTGAALEEIEKYLEKQTLKEYTGTTIKIEKFKNLDIVIRKRIIRKAIEEAAGRLKDITSVHVEDILSLCEKQVGKYVMLPCGIRASRTYEDIVLEKVRENLEKQQIFFEIKEKGEYIIPDGMGKMIVSFIDSNQIPEKGENMYTKCFDYDKIKDNLHLRTRKEGDFIQINPNGNTKKIKAYFIDEKIPNKQRDSVLLLTKDSHVLWVVGYRVSEEYRVTKETKSIIKFEYRRG